MLERMPCQYTCPVPPGCAHCDVPAAVQLTPRAYGMKCQHVDLVSRDDTYLWSSYMTHRANHCHIGQCAFPLNGRLQLRTCFQVEDIVVIGLAEKVLKCT